MPLAATTRRCLAALLLMVAVAVAGCGDANGPADDKPVATTTTRTQVEPLTSAERARVRSAERRVVSFCAEVARFIAGERPRPSAAELGTVYRAIDRHAVVARIKPEAALRPGVDVRTALGDLAENLEGVPLP